MSFIAEAQHAMRVWERHWPSPPARVYFSGCRRRAQAVTCRVREEWDYVSEDDSTEVVLEGITRLRAVKTARGWRVRELS